MISPKLLLPSYACNKPPVFSYRKMEYVPPKRPSISTTLPHVIFNVTVLFISFDVKTSPFGLRIEIGNVTLRCFRFMFTPHPPPKRPGIISLEQRAFMAIQCRRQKDTYVGLCVKCPIFLSDVNQISFLSTDFHYSTQVTKGPG